MVVCNFTFRLYIMNKFLNIIGFFIGFFGLIIGIISYVNTVKKKEISYNIYSPSYKVYDNEAINVGKSLNIILSDSTKVNRNIYLTTFSIWNSGDLPINKEDLRKNIEFRFSGIEKVINFNIIKEVENGVSDFQFIPKNDSIFRLNWKYFDPKNGIKVQIIYFGKEKISCHLDGLLLETEFKEFIPIQNMQKSIKPWMLILLVLVIFYLVFSSFINLFRKVLIKAQTSTDYIFNLISPILMFLMTAYIIYYLYFKIQDIPF